MLPPNKSMTLITPRGHFLVFDSATHVTATTFRSLWGKKSITFITRETIFVAIFNHRSVQSWTLPLSDVILMCTIYNRHKSITVGRIAHPKCLKCRQYETYAWSGKNAPSTSLPYKWDVHEFLRTIHHVHFDNELYLNAPRIIFNPTNASISSRVTGYQIFVRLLWP